MVEDIARILAANIRDFRKARNFTLTELSRKSGVSVSMISKIENSQSLPSIATYSRIASALEVSFDSLLAGSEGNAEVSIVRASERPIVSRGSYIASPLAFKRAKKKMQPFVFEYPFSKRFPRYRHQSEEMIFVLKGTIEFKYGENVFVLRRGDCCYYEGSVTHGGRSLSPKGSKAIVVQSNL